MFEILPPTIYTTNYPKMIYVQEKENISQNKYISYEEQLVNKTIEEIKKISDYEIENYDFEKIDDEIIALGIKLKNFPKNKNKVSYSIELMNKLDDKLPDNIDIFVI